MAAAEVPAKDEPFMSFSFLQHSNTRKCHKSNRSNDSGINIEANGCIVILSDDESDTQGTADLELLCEIDVNTGKMLPLPQPFEDKPICKTEFGTGNTSAPAHISIANVCSFTAGDDEEDEMLLPLAKVESIVEDESGGGDAGSNTNSYILYVCPQCGLTFELGSEWRAHINLRHQLGEQSTYDFTQRCDNEFECNKCQLRITRCTLRMLQQHRFTHLPFKVYKCKLCPFEAQTIYLMLSHIMLHKNHEELEVGQPVPRLSLTLEHESSQLMEYICPSCGVSFNDEDAWQAHINFRHDFLEKIAENRYHDHFKCTECSVEIFSQHVSDLQQHLFTHLPYKAYLKCKLCKWTVSRRHFMVSHMLSLHKSHLSPAATATILSNNMQAVSYELPEKRPPAEVKKLLTNDTRALKTKAQQTESSRKSATAIVSPAAATVYPVQICESVLKKPRQSQTVETEPLALKRCNSCGKAYNYTKSYEKHVRKCRASPRNSKLN